MSLQLFSALPTDIQADFQLARQQLAHAFPPHHTVKVGAVLRADGQLFTGANVRRRGFSGSTCAERFVLDSALQAGVHHLERLVTIVATSTPHDQTTVATCGPCGLCRQQYMEALDLLGDRDLPIYFSNEQLTEVVGTQLSALLPYAYRKLEGQNG